MLGSSSVAAQLAASKLKPTNDQLRKINLKPSYQFSNCKETGTEIHILKNTEER
jgi:hypothetical protein